MVLLNDHGHKMLLLTRVIMTNHGLTMFGSGNQVVTMVLLNDHGNIMLLLTRVIMTNHVSAVWQW